MKKTTIYCNLCGEEFTTTDEMCGFLIEKRIGYGSMYDGERIALDLCCTCLDKLIGSCKINPVKRNPAGADEADEPVWPNTDQVKMGF